MKKNIGTKDRLLRLFAALGLAAYALWQDSWIAGLASLFVFYEVLASWCLFYHLIGKNSCSLPPKDTQK